MALLQEIMCNLKHPMGLRRPVPQTSRVNPVKWHSTHEQKSGLLMFAFETSGFKQVASAVSLSLPLAYVCFRNKWLHESLSNRAKELCLTRQRQSQRALFDKTETEPKSSV